MKGKIDVHHHIVPEFYLEAITTQGLTEPPWTPEAQRNLMNLVGIERAYMSITAPGATLYPDHIKNRELARKLNDYMKEHCQSDPEHLKFFGTLPNLFDIEGVLNEIDYTHNILKADGFTLFTTYVSPDDNQYYYLGNPVFAPIWERFNSIKAIIFIHPRRPPTEKVNKYLNYGYMDFTFETCRTAADLVTGADIRRSYPDVKVILSHGGGVLPMIAERISGGVAGVKGEENNLSPPEIYRNTLSTLEDFKFFYYDVACTFSSSALLALYDFADHDKILYGSDFPYLNPQTITFVDNLRSKNPEIGQDKFNENAEKLFSRIN